MAAKQSPPEPFEAEEDFSILDILLILTRHRKLICIITAVITVLGLLIALGQTMYYTASASVIRETVQEQQSSFSGLSVLRGLGINIGGGTLGLSVDAYPDIIRSREVRLAVAQSPYNIPGIDSTINLIEYFDGLSSNLLSLALSGLKKITIGLPGTIKRLLSGSPSNQIASEREGSFLHLTESEEQTLQKLEKMVSIDVNRGTGIMTISVNSPDPYLSVQIVNVSIEHLNQRVLEIYTQKNRENLDFIRERSKKAEKELEQSEGVLAQFIDRNRNPQTARLRTEMERLQRKVDFKTQLYSDLQTQFTQAEIELQRSLPVITVLERPLLPLVASGPNRKLIVLFSLILGFFVGTGITFVKNKMSQTYADQEEGAKLKEIRDTLVPSRLRRSS